MTSCEKCKKPAKFVAENRFGLFKTKPRYLCEQHAKLVERTEDIILAAALIVTVLLAVLSFVRDQRTKQQRIHDAEQQRLQTLDLDRNGIVSIFEEQLTSEQRDAFQVVGYPFTLLFQNGRQPDKPIRNRLDPAAIVQVFTDANAPNSLLSYLSHPRLMRSFVEKHSGSNCTSCIAAVYLTSDDYLAFLLRSTTTGQTETIGLEKVAPDLAKMLSTLPAAPGEEKKPGKK